MLEQPSPTEVPVSSINTSNQRIKAFILRNKKVLIISTAVLVFLIILSSVGYLVLFKKSPELQPESKQMVATTSAKIATTAAEMKPTPIKEEKPKSTDTTYKMPVLVLNYFPTHDGINTLHGSISEMREKTNKITQELILTLEEGSTYHGYKNSNATPSLDYSVVDTKEFLKRIPLSSTSSERGDKFKMFSDSSIGVADICDYVDQKGIKEVWIWMYHIEETKLGNLTVYKTGPTESNMAMGKDSKQYWNYGSFGDVSNSGRANDLPTCNKTYTVYEYNYSRQLSEATENHMHQIEHVLNWIDGRHKTVDRDWKNLLFWGKFVGSDKSHKIINPGCGWSHYPPNGKADYDWGNNKKIETDCEDWKPDGSGKRQSFNCSKWSCDSVKFFKWWMQNIPGKDNGLIHKGKALRNWWDFIGDFDKAISSNQKLY